MESKDIRELNKLYMEAVYGGGKKEEKKDTRLVVTAADKKANTKAYQNYKAGNKAYKAADHLKEDEKYGYDKDGNSLNPVDIEKRKKEDDDLAGAPNKKGKKKAKRWWDDDGDGKGYEDGEVDGKFKKKKDVKESKAPVGGKPNAVGNLVKAGADTVKGAAIVGGAALAAKKLADKKKDNDVKEAVVQTYGTKGKLKKELKDLGKGAETLKGKNIAKADKVAEEVLDEKESYKTVAAVIDYDRSKKGTDDATYDSLHGKKKAAKKERDYAAWEREKMKKDDPNWKHKKGSTSESVEIESLINSGVFSEEEIAKIVEADRLGKLEESEKVAQGAQKRAEVLASRRRQKGYREQGYNAYRPGKNERAGYNLARAARSSDASPETQRTKKKKPAGEDTSQIGHYKKRDEKVTVGKRGKPLSRPKYKLSMGQRVDHHSNKALSRRDPKQNPKHEANK